MSAVVLPGNKRSFFEDNSPPLAVVSSKRLRYSSTSPIRCFSPPIPNSHTLSPPPSPTTSPAVIDHLVSIFPDMDKELLEKALKECGNDLDSAIRSLNELRLGSVEGNFNSEVEKIEQSSQGMTTNSGEIALAGMTTNSGEIASADDPSLPSDNLPKDGPEWVELFVREMASAANIDDARARASRVLEVLEKSICVSAGAEAVQNFQMENMMLKKKVEELIHENTILKRAVAIQHERQKESDTKSQELDHLKQLVSQYQEQLRTLEVNNYALTVHLKQAQQSSSMPGRFHPDIF